MILESQKFNKHLYTHTTPFCNKFSYHQDNITTLSRKQNKKVTNEWKRRYEYNVKMWGTNAKAETLYNFEYSLLSIYFSLQWTFPRFNISKMYKSFYVIHPAVKNYSEWVDFWGYTLVYGIDMS